MAQQKIKTLRIYLRGNAKKPGKSFWKKLWSKPLAEQFIDGGRELGITHIFQLQITKAYLQGQLYYTGHAQVEFPNFMQCIELVGSSEKIELLLQLQKENLKEALLCLLHEETKVLN